jgi:hypothetical protein
VSKPDLRSNPVEQPRRSGIESVPHAWAPAGPRVSDEHNFAAGSAGSVKRGSRVRWIEEFPVRGLVFVNGLSGGEENPA